MSLFSHEFHEDSSDEFGTPAEFHRPLADAVGGFDLDPASGAESKPLASTRYTKEDDGLSQEWFGTVWLNPPFSEKTRWVRKTRAEVSEGNVETAVVLLPVDTSTKLFHNHVTDATAICFVEGRLSFDGGDRNPNFGTLLAVFGAAPDDLLNVLDRKGSVFRAESKHERTEQQELVTDGGTDQHGNATQCAPGAGHAGPLLSARCTGCRKVTEKRTARVVGELSSGSFKHACHTCQSATWWNVLRVVDEENPHAVEGSA